MSVCRSFGVAKSLSLDDVEHLSGCCSCSSFHHVFRLERELEDVNIFRHEVECSPQAVSDLCIECQPNRCTSLAACRQSVHVANRSEAKYEA
jgi:hypothetical protein